MKKLILFTGMIALLAGCTSKSQLEKTIADNPDIVFNAIKKNPKKFVETVNEAVREAQMSAREDEAKEEQARMEEEFKNPKQPAIEDGRVIFGKKDAPVTIVEYTDFQCPYCARGYNTIKEVLKNYPDQVRVVLKHLPLDFHPLAMPAAKYFEAIAKQDHSKAEKFHDMIFSNQAKLNQDGEKFLKDAAKKVGANLKKVEKDLSDDSIQERINADMEEARKFEFTGTPGFLINGVSLKGAYPFQSNDPNVPDFKKIIDRHLSKN